MDARKLPARPSVEQYKKQAKDLVKSRKAGDPESIQRIKHYHPRLNKLSDSEIGSAMFALADAQLVVAREHTFESWPEFVKHIEGMSRRSSPVSQFEAAVDAIVTGDAATLDQLLRDVTTTS